MKIYLTLFFSCSILIACSSKKEMEQQIPIDKMKVVLWDLMKADEFYTRKAVVDTSWKNEKKNVQFYQQIFEFYKIDRVQFYKQMEFMKSHPIEFKELMDSVNELSKREKNNTIQGIKKV